MKKLIRGIAILLAAMLMLSLLPMVRGYAAEEEPETSSVQGVIAESTEVIVNAGEEAIAAVEEVFTQEIPAEDLTAEAPAAEAVPEGAEAAQGASAEETAASGENMDSAQKPASVFVETDTQTVSNPAMAIRAEAPFDNSTTVPDGTYNLTDKEYSFEGGTGKARLTATQVIVEGGKATAVFTASSANMTHVYIGTVSSDAEDTSIYNPETGEKGVNVYEIVNKTVTIPVRLNEKVAFAGRTTAMSEPHWIQYAYTITLAEDSEDDQDKKADYTAVDAALAKVPADLSVYTDDSVAALQAAVAAVVRDKPASEQAAVNAMAQAIETAVNNLKVKPVDGRVDLAITNTTGMFKAVTAYLLTQDGKSELVMALNGSGYHELYKGTYEQAVANGNNRNNWIHGAVNAAGKWEFRIPVAEGETYIPLVAISDSYVQGYDQGKNSLERAFYPRQLLINLTDKTLVTGDYENNTPLAIVNNVRMFKPESAELETIGGPNSNNYSSKLYLTMGSDAFDKVFFGTKDKADAATIYEINGRTFALPVRWVETFGRPETMQTVIGKPVVLSFHSVNKDEWYEREFFIDEENAMLTINPADEGGGGSDPVVPDPGGDSKKDDPEKQYDDDVGGNTAAVDNSTSLPDGVYTPDKFSFSGGSGRIAISCNKVEVRGGKAYATLVFTNLRSGVTEMSYVKASGGTYYCTQSGGDCVVTIPVELNQNNTILALTTKMSAAHEIEYTIFVYINGADAQKGSELTSNKSLDEEAPVIAGLEYTGEEKIEDAEYFKIFNYSDGIRLLEIDMRPVKDKEANKDTEQEMKEEAKDSDEDGTTTIIDEETGAEIEVKASKADAQAALYKGNVVKYLLVPENVEIPAGLDKETIVIQLPVKSVYAGSEEIYEVLKSLGLEKLVTSQPKEDKDNNIAGAGDYKDLDIKALVKSKCDLVILPTEALKDKKEREIFNSLAEDLANLDIPVIVDRSKDEKTEKAKAEWLKVYGILFGCEEAAQKAYEAVK